MYATTSSVPYRDVQPPLHVLEDSLIADRLMWCRFAADPNVRGEADALDLLLRRYAGTETEIELRTQAIDLIVDAFGFEALTGTEGGTR